MLEFFRKLTYKMHEYIFDQILDILNRHAISEADFIAILLAEFETLLCHMRILKTSRKMIRLWKRIDFYIWIQGNPNTIKKWFHTAWILIWIPAKRRNFWQWFHIQKNKWKLKNNREKRSCGQFWRVALTRRGQSSQSVDFWKIAKMAIFNPCMKIKIFWGPNLWILFIKWFRLCH